MGLGARPKGGSLRKVKNEVLERVSNSTTLVQGVPEISLPNPGDFVFFQIRSFFVGKI